MIGNELLRFQKDQKYLLFDYETCNLNLCWEKNLPWEYAAWLVTSEKIIEKYIVLINWELMGKRIEVGDQAALLTGYYMKYPRLLAEGKHPLEVINEIDKHMYDPNIIPVAHNGLGFDVYIHNTHRRLTGKPTDYSYVKRFLDTNLIAKGLKLEVPLPNNLKDLRSYQYKLYSHIVKGVKTSVKAVCEDFQIPYDETRAHDAEYDCSLLYEILKQLLWKVEI